MDSTMGNKNSLGIGPKTTANDRNSGSIMHGRRSHKRMAIANFEGVLSVLHDVVVSRTESGEVLAMDREPHQVVR